ncbi:DUF1674 domain-containing protein [Sphingomonas sp. HF-S3]|jgi:hypothetical protein|uniref:DUF1674 domain-containing protein n=1 Tax=Sphingomonas rustica TaxID=3103142 RepID=A0ABV0BAF5_9SPHN
MGQRPPHLKPPEYLTPTQPVPEPRPLPEDRGEDPLGQDPTRFGDWERKGIAIDF